MRLQVVILPLVAVAMLAGCEQEPPVVDQPEVPVEPVIEEEEVMPTEPMEGASLEQAVEAARRDLADRTDTSADRIRVVDARRVTWRDGALGCPEEGMMYTQALVDGMYILLAVDGEAHAYHAGRDGVPFPCPAERSQEPLDDGGGYTDR
jgi:hypothetical protein